MQILYHLLFVLVLAVYLQLLQHICLKQAIKLNHDFIVIIVFLKLNLTYFE